jgi:hypothetical protein
MIQRTSKNSGSMRHERSGVANGISRGRWESTTVSSQVRGTCHSGGTEIDGYGLHKKTVRDHVPYPLEEHFAGNNSPALGPRDGLQV